METNFDIITKILENEQPLIAREVAKRARKLGNEWERKDVNSALYKMLNLGLVQKIPTEKSVEWKLINQSHSNGALQILHSEEILKKIRKFKVKSLEHVVNESNFEIRINDLEIDFAYNLEFSSNDPYISVDWLQDRLFITVNSQHPFWETYINSKEEKLLYLQFIAQDALIQWHVAKIGDKISSSDLLQIRDKVLREIALKNLK